MREKMMWWMLFLLLLPGCNGNDTSVDPSAVPEPICEKSPTGRVDQHTPESMVSDWEQPVRLGSPVNTPCPQDAIEISPDGEWLYVMYTEDLLENLNPGRILAPENNTYRLRRGETAVEFGTPEYYDLGKGVTESLDGEVSFAGDSLVYFHSLRLDNTGYQQDPPTDDILDLYVANLADGIPGPGRNLGSPVNSPYLDGEGAIHPDGISLYFASNRPGGYGDADLYLSRWDGGNWSEPENLGATINSFAQDFQVTFTADGDTMYFTSGRNPLIGVAIFRSHRNGDDWSEPELVMKGIVGEPSLTADGQHLYFVHVLSDGAGTFDADVWVSHRVP